MNESFMRKINVMVVDSDGELSFEVEGMLAAKVKTIRYVKDPVEAIKVFNTLMPQIVILDLKLAMMDIVELSSKIKAINPDCEIIIALGFVEPHKLIEMVNMGIHRFVIKPLSVPKLAEAISKSVDALLDKAVAFQSKYMQEILNTEDTPVFATDGTSVLKANKAFLDCFGAKSLNQFLLRYSSLDSIFALEDVKTDSKEWFRDFILNSKEPKIQVYDNRRGEKRVFLLDMGVSESAKEYYVVTMTDITDLESDFERKIEMLSSQIASKEKIKFRSMLELEIARCKRYKKTFSLVLIGFDMDESASIEEWEKIFKIVRKTLRSSDIFAKVDKNQLAVIATETQKDGAKKMLDRLRSEFNCMDGESCKIRFVGGAAEFSENDTVQSMFKKAASGMA